jgi:hypothetical protein
MPQYGSYLGRGLGCRDADHLARWAAALAAGRAKLRCSAVTKTTGEPCRAIPLKFSDSRCTVHCVGAERVRVDQLRLAWLQRLLRRKSIGEVLRANVQARIDKIERRRLRHVWKLDPSISGSTIRLMPADHERACRWLRDVAGIDPSLLTARAYDQCLWASALCLSHRYDEETALLKVKKALQDEELWRAKTFQAA